MSQCLWVGAAMAGAAARKEPTRWPPWHATQRGTRRTGATSGVLLLLGLGGAVLLVAELNSMNLSGPVFLALVTLTVAAHPLRTHLLRRGLPGWVAGLAMMLVIYLTTMRPGGPRCCSAVPQLARLVPEYESEWDRGSSRATAWLPSRASCRQPGQRRQARPRPPRRRGRRPGRWAAGTTSTLALVGVMVVFFMTLDELVLRASPAPARRGARWPRRSRRCSASGTRRYLVVSTVFGLIVAVFDTLALVWIGVPGAALWGASPFVTNYVPNIGFVIGIVPPTVLALLEAGPRWR